MATELKAAHVRGDLFNATVLTIHCHAFTHVDAPLHFLPGTKPIAEMPVEQWMGEAAVVDLTHVPKNGEVTAADLERHGQHVRAGDIVLLCSDGLSDVVKDEEIAAVLFGTNAAEAACRSLVDLALVRGAPDNVTAVVSRYEAS